MSADPILILQTRRMGDLILTFPLLLSLQRRWPANPVWVVGENAFFQPLMPLAPRVVFFPPSHYPALSNRRYKLILNLSAGLEAATLLDKAQAETKLGPMQTSQGLRVQGRWQLYRMALTQSNRHNCFHWSDLYRMDIEQSSDWPSIGLTRPRSAERSRRVGLVLGASEVSKRPDALFWARLAQKLAAEGFVPLLLGGQADRELGHEVAKTAHLPQANYCAKLRLEETASLMRGLALCITPDTGPMHLADWLGVPVLNLSMGPVQAWETGPVSPGQWILRPRMSCAGCWQCQKGKLSCRRTFTPAAVASLALAIIRGDLSGMTARAVELPGLELYRSSRDALGLYELQSLDGPSSPPSARQILDRFWKACFLSDILPELSSEARRQAHILHGLYPRLSQHLQSALARCIARCANGLKRPGHGLSGDLWYGQAPMLRLFAGHLHMSLQNADYSTTAWQDALRRITTVSDFLADRKAEILADPPMDHQI